MRSSKVWEGYYRKVWTFEEQEFIDHLLRLDSKSRHMRFSSELSDEAVKKYASHAIHNNCRIWGYFDHKGILRGCGELATFKRSIRGMPENCAEASFSIETDHQETGVGSELLKLIIRSARNRKIEHLYMHCLAKNVAMQRMARKFSDDLKFELGDVICEVTPEHATPFSHIHEALDDGNGIMMAIYDLRNRWWQMKMH